MVVKYLVVMLGLVCLSNAASTGTFTNSNSLGKLQNNLQALQNDIGGISASLANSDTTVTDLRLRVDSLETTMQQIKRVLDDTARQQGQDSQAQVSDLTNSFNSLQRQLSQVQDRIKVKEEAALPQECISAIKGRNFGLAGEKLNQLNDEFKTNLVIKEVYNHQSGNFDLILKFAASLENIGKTLWVLNALKYERETNGHVDVVKDIALIERLNTDVVQQKNVFEKQKTEAENLVAELETRVVKNFKQSLKDGMEQGSIADSSKTIADTVHTYKNSLLTRVFKDALDDVYYSVDTWKVIAFLGKMSYIEELIGCLDVLFVTMETKQHMDQPSILGVAHAVQDMLSQDSYHKIHQVFKDTLTRIKNKLPGSVRDIALSETHCIKSVSENKYMYAAIDYFKYSDKRRNIFAWIPGNRVKNGDWQFEHISENKYFIRNKGFNEYLYLSEISYDDDRRYMFTWMDNTKVKNSVFEVEPSGNNVYIKSVDFNEYVYTANNYFNYDEERKRIFAWKTKNKDHQALWNIVSC